MRLIFIIFAVFALSFVNAITFKEKIAKGHPGDYVVTYQQGIYTVLLLREVSPNTLILEEISIPDIDRNSDLSWRQWIEEKAPGHSSWTAYHLDLEHNKLIECYSYSQNAWLSADDPNHFLTKLLTLSLERTPTDKRKRIGPPPSSEEIDHRAFWNPSVIIEGKSNAKPPIVAWTGRWPQDQTLIAGCEVELYFGNFAFPYWIEIKTPHYAAPIRSVDSGSLLSSPMPTLPQRPPLFTSPAKWSNNHIELQLSCPCYFTQLNLFVIDLSDETHPTIPLAASMRRGEDERVILEISPEAMQNTLQKGHRYQWVVVPDNSPRVLTESEYIFIW